MFCPECGRALPDAKAHFCPFCGNRIILPPDLQTAAETPLNAPETPEPQTAAETYPNAPETPEPEAPAAPIGQESAVSRSKICTAALLLGTGTVVSGMFTLILRILNADLRVLGAAAVTTFFFAPLACVFGLCGIVVRAKDPHKRGLPSAIFGLALGLAFGLVAAYCLLRRILFY